MATQAPPTGPVGSLPSVPGSAPPTQAPAGAPVASPGHAPTGAPGSAAPPMGPGAPSVAPGATAPVAGPPKGPVDLKTINPFQAFGGASFTMAITGCVVYLFAFVAHTVQMFKYKTWYLNLIPQSALMSVISMIARTHAIIVVKEQGATGAFMVHMIISAIAPTLLNFANIFTFTRIMWWVTPNDKRNAATLWGPPRQMSLCWGLAVMVPDITKMVGQKAFKQGDISGVRLQTIGQMVQAFVITMFFVMTLRFMVISRRWLIHGECEEKNWRALGWVTVTIGGLMAFRHVFAQVAFDAQQDHTGKSFYGSHEWVYWATQELPVFVVLTLWNLHYPGAFLPFEYCRFKFDVKKVEKAKHDNTWPLQISNPIRNRDEEYAPRHDDFVRPDDKGIEITLTEMAPNKEYGRK